MEFKKRLHRRFFLLNYSKFSKELFMKTTPRDVLSTLQK